MRARTAITRLAGAAALAVALAAGRCPAQDGAAAGDAADLVAAIAGRFRRIEACARTLAIEVAIEVHELDGEILAPPRSAKAAWRTRAGRTLVSVQGCDLDAAPESRPAEAARVRLYLPGGIAESVDGAAGSFMRDQRSYLDAGCLASDLAPSEFLWTFCGTYRS